MKQFAILAALLVFSCLPAAAQDEPRAELFGGYQYTHLEPSLDASGWNASIAVNLTNWFGVAGDFSGAYKSGFKFHTFMFGPVVSLRRSERFTPFAHVLFGGAQASDGRSITGSTMGLGGGADVKISRKFAVRLFQADWMATHFGGNWVHKNARVSSGIVLRF